MAVIRLLRFEFRRFASILLVALGLAVLIPVFHHHEDGRIQDGCPLCVYMAHHTDIALQDDQPVFLFDCSLLVSSESGFTFLSTFHSQFLIRAPPT
jgi:hypothetical protein